MNQDFKFKFDEMLDNNLAQPYDATAGKGDTNSTEYAGPSNVRNLAFVLPDKNFIFLNYSYLVAVNYEHSENIVWLAFTTHLIKLKGVRLESLAFQLMQQLPRIIICVEDRYNALEENKPVVNMIEVVEH